MATINNAKVWKKMFKDIKQFPKLFAKDFHNRLVDKTPNPPSIRADGTGPSTGNLKKSWKYKISTNKITFTNDAEYASYVEYGTSKMRGAHMLAATINEAQRIANRAVKKARRT